MKTLFFDNRHLLILVIALVIVGGLSAAFTLPRLEDPFIRGRNSTIVTFLPGASAERVEALVTEKLEEEFQEVAEIDYVESDSRAGVSLIRVEVKGSINDVDRVWTDIRDRVADAEPLLPPGASKPDFDDTRGPWAFSLILGLKWEGEGEPRMGILKRMADELAERLRNLSGTRLARVYGDPEEEITVTIDANRLSDLGLTPAEVSSRIAAADSKVSAGALRAPQRDLLIEVAGELDSLQRISRIPLRRDGQGGIVRLGDVAEVERRPRAPQAEEALVDGRPAVMVAARVGPDLRLDHWTEEALAVIDEFESELSSGIALKTIFQQSEYTVARLQQLLGNLLLGIAIVVFILFVTMGWRAALLVGSALPLSSAAVLFGLQLLNVPLHQMSITGLIIALGLLIDNAIVMVDDVRRRLQAGTAPRQALSQSLGHLFVPLLGSNLTTVLAFLPILLLSGAVGEFVGTVALSVILAILSSFFFAMTVVPAVTAILGCASAGSRWWQDGFHSLRLSRIYRRLLEFLVRRPAWGLGIGVAVPVLGFLLAPTLEKQFFPPSDRNQFYVQMWMSSDSSLENTKRQAQRVEDLLRRDPSILEVAWLIGASAPTFYYNLLMNQDGSSRFAQALVQVRSGDDVRETVIRLQGLVDSRLPEAQTVLRLLGQGPPFDAPIEVRLKGPSLTELRRLGDELRVELARMPEVLHSRATLRRSEPKLWVAADEDEALQAGLTLTEVAQQLQDSLEGRLGGSLLEETEELPVRIRYADGRRRSLESLNSLNLVSSASDRWIPLAGLGQTVLRPEFEAIPHRDGRRVNVVKGYLRADALAPEIMQEFLQRLESSDFRLPAGYSMEVGGEAEEQQAAVANLLLYVPVLAVLMLTALVLSFRSFALAGVIGLVAIQSVGLGMFAIWVSGFPYGFMAMIGTAGLIGVAINDSIVVLAAIRAHSGDSIVEPVLDSTRHIVATTLTTGGGFLPLILSGGGFWPPLAIVTAGGVAGATMLALIFTPSAYALLVRWGAKSAKPSQDWEISGDQAPAQA